MPDDLSDAEEAERAIFEHVLRRIDPFTKLLTALWQTTHDESADAWAQRASGQLRDSLLAYPRNPFIATQDPSVGPLGVALSIDFVKFFAERVCRECGMNERWPAELLSRYWQGGSP